MATKKSATTAKKTTAKRSTPAKAAATKTTKTKVTTVKAVTATKRETADTSLPFGNLFRIVGAEVIGTLVLTLVALLAFQQFAPLYVGLTVVVLVLALGAVSGSHLNPAVTFGLWASGRLKSILLPFYWSAQFLGAIIAVVLINAVSNNSLSLSFDNFLKFNANITTVEFIGTAVFVFGLTAVLSQVSLPQVGKAFGIGLSLFAGLLVSISLFTAALGGVDTSEANLSEPDTIPREYRVTGATLNPAVALATSENTDLQLQGQNAGSDEVKQSRLGLEVIVGTLAGAALGANLYTLLTWTRRTEKKA